MKLPIEVRLSAQIEAENAIEFYERRRTGLGAKLRAALELTIERISEHPESGREVIPGVRRIVVPKYKYRVFYVVEADRLIVVGIYHASQSDEDVPQRIGRVR